jgi:hypothetical protein
MIKRLFILTHFFWLSSCVDYFKGTNCTFEIVNDTDLEISIFFFDDSVQKTKIVIGNNSVYSKTIKNWNGEDTPIPANPDSVIIKFGEIRYSEQYCGGKSFFGNFGECFFEKNFIDQASWLNSKKNGKLLKRIILNNSDFEKAIPL